MKRMIIAVSCLLLITTSVLMVAPVILAEGSSTKSYDLEEVIDDVLDKNSSLNLLSEKINLAEKRYDDAEDRDAKDSEIMKLRKNIDDLQQEREDKEKELVLKATELYHDIQINQDTIRLQSAQIDRLAAEYDSKVKQVELENTTESTLSSYKVAVSEAEAKLASLYREKEKLIMDLNILAGNGVNQKLILKNESIPEDHLNIKDMDELVEKLLDESYSITSLEEDFSILHEQKDELEDANVDGANDSSIDNLRDQIIDLSYKIEDTRKSLELQVRTGYNNLQNLKDNISISDLDNEKLTELAKAAELKYELGLITYLEYYKAQEDADNASIRQQQTKLDYYIALKKFKNLVESAL